MFGSASGRRRVARNSKSSRAADNTPCRLQLQEPLDRLLVRWLQQFVHRHLLKQQAPVTYSSLCSSNMVPDGGCSTATWRSIPSRTAGARNRGTEPPGTILRVPIPNPNGIVISPRPSHLMPMWRVDAQREIEHCRRAKERRYHRIELSITDGSPDNRRHARWRVPDRPTAPRSHLSCPTMRSQNVTDALLGQRLETLVYGQEPSACIRPGPCSREQGTR